MGEALQKARQAVEQHDWAAARDGYAIADQEEPLGPDDLKLLADAAWWDGEPDESVEAYERAHAGYVAAGDIVEAAHTAGWLAYLAFRRNAFAVGGGWMGKAEQLLEGQPESAAHAWLALLAGAGAMNMGGDMDEAIANIDRAVELARRYDVPEVDAMATSYKGYVLISAGDWQQGMALVDKAAATAVSGDIELRVACDVFCNTIAACRNMGDYGRAGEWTEEADRWMERQSLGGYRGICRVHRAELKKLRGSYAEAEQEALAASEELVRYRLLDGVASAYKEVGEVKLRRGDLESAESAFSDAFEYGSDAQPGLALLMLSRGDAEGAAASLASSLGGGSGSSDEATSMRLTRSRLLPAQVAIALANDDAETAHAAAEELESIAAEFERPAFQAGALAARGAIALDERRTDEAVAMLDRAWRLWREIEFPYESAQARVLLGQARAAAGDEVTARRDLEAARAAFERLGAVFDVRRVEELLGDDATASGGDGRRVTKTFMFTDIVTSTDLVEILGDEAWEDLIRWHDSALRSEIAKHRGHEVRYTGDGFFVAFDNAGDAVEAAVAIQRRLASHRREHGFAPWVRIGLHTAEATRQGNDYAGQGIHVAARVGDIGAREEIVISSDALEAAGAIRFPLSDARSETLKGVSEPVDVHTIDWR